MFVTRTPSPRRCIWIALMALLAPLQAFADPPGFDRPGIAFSPSVLPAGSFDWEQGLPDAQFASTGALHTRQYSANSTFRFGLTPTLELQVAGAVWNRLDTTLAGVRSHAIGSGDPRIGLKWARPIAQSDLSVGVLAAVALRTGSDAFSAGHTITSLGTVLGRDLGGGRNAAAYVNVDHGAGANAWTGSANYGFPLRGDVAGYVEAGRVAGAGNAITLAGGGVTWLVAGRLQFDAYALHGLTQASPDLQAGFGVSLFWK